ncbi:hypothetical protein MBLNU457_5330t1 [Dothideomycetes sp. NU457]
MPPLLDAYPHLLAGFEDEVLDDDHLSSSSDDYEDDTPDTTLSSIASTAKASEPKVQPKRKPDTRTTSKQKKTRPKAAELAQDAAISPVYAPYGRRSTRQSVRGRSQANYDMKVHPLDEFQRPAYWKKRHDTQRSSQRSTGEEYDGAFEHDHDDSDDLDPEADQLSVTQSTENQSRTPDPKAIRASARIRSQPYHDYSLILPTSFPHRSRKSGKKNTKSTKPRSRKRQKTSHPLVGNIDDVDEAGYHIVFDHFPSTAAWSPWQRVKFPTPEPSSNEDENGSIPFNIVFEGSKRNPVAVSSDDRAMGGVDSSPGGVIAGSEAGGRGEEQPLPGMANLQQADIVFRDLYVADPVAPFARMQTVDPVQTLHSSSPLTELATIEDEEPSLLGDMISFVDEQYAMEAVEGPEVLSNLYQYQEDDDDDDPAAGPMFSDPRTPPNGVRDQALALMDAAYSQTRSRAAENTDMMSDTVGVDIPDDQRSHSSVDRFFEERDTVETVELNPAEGFPGEADFCVVM